MTIDIDNCIGLDEMFNRNYKLTLRNGKLLYMSLDRNEITDENSLLLLNKVISGQKINTLGNKNINKLFKKTNY